MLPRPHLGIVTRVHACFHDQLSVGFIPPWWVPALAGGSNVRLVQSAVVSGPIIHTGSPSVRPSHAPRTFGALVPIME